VNFHWWNPVSGGNSANIVKLLSVSVSRKSKYDKFLILSFHIYKSDSIVFRPELQIESSPSTSFDSQSTTHAGKCGGSGSRMKIRFRDSHGTRLSPFIGKIRFSCKPSKHSNFVGKYALKYPADSTRK